MIEMYEFFFFVFLRQRDKHRKGRGFLNYKFLNFRIEYAW